MPPVRARILLSLFLLSLAGMSPVRAQCILANPSFELPGSGGQTFGGWNQFGSVGASGSAPHGAAAARVSGPNTGGWDVSGYWQRLDSTAGDRWRAAVLVWHTATNSLTGESRAIVNIEWRDAGGTLISYESHTAADAATPVDEIQLFTVESGPAPQGTAAVHFLLAVLQSPSDPAPDVYYDLAEFDPPTLDALQWSDFPGGRTIGFSGWSWRVKGPGFYGPGPNLFCDSGSCVWVDADGRMHLTLQFLGGSWYSTEVTLEEPLGYGDYVFTTLGRPDALDPQAVLGLFIWQYGSCYDPANGWWNPYNEIDVEFSRWGDPANDAAQFVAQPFDYPGNISRFDATFTEDELSSHAFRWLPDRVEYRSWRGGPQDETPTNLIHSWTYTGPHIPRPEQPRVHMNLWAFEAPPSSAQEVVIDRFTFTPEGSGTVGSPAEEPVLGGGTRLSVASPNPFAPGTTIRFSLPSAGSARIDVFDVSGRLVRRLVDRPFSAGTNLVFWNGVDDSGRPVGSGVYLYRLQTNAGVESRRIVRLP